MTPLISSYTFPEGFWTRPTVQENLKKISQAADILLILSSITFVSPTLCGSALIVGFFKGYQVRQLIMDEVIRDLRHHPIKMAIVIILGSYFSEPFRTLMLRTASAIYCAFIGSAFKIHLNPPERNQEQVRHIQQTKEIAHHLEIEPLPNQTALEVGRTCTTSTEQNNVYGLQFDPQPTDIN